MTATFGNKIKFTIFGESHGLAIGCVIDGIPPGVALNLEGIRKEMQRRAPGKSKLATARQEKDAFIIQSGFFEGKTTGTPMCVLIPNSDQHSGDYSKLQNVMRPGHADYSGKIKYKGFNDYRGGGHFSGRLTAPLVFLGAAAKQILAQRDIYVGAHIASIGNVQDKMFNPLGETAVFLTGIAQKTFPVIDDGAGEDMKQLIWAAKQKCDSVGGVIECMAINMPAGVGEPFFDSLESRLAHALFSVPAVKGIEFGKGFALAQMLGSEANDQMYYDDGVVKTYTNNNGGITGGITNSMPVLFRVAVKPTPSIAKVQKTVDLSSKTNTELVINGRHDPCIVQRAVPVIEGVAAWVLLDMLLAGEN